MIKSFCSERLKGEWLKREWLKGQALLLRM